MKATVLIIEDDSDTRHALHLRLQAAGYETLMAADGTLAIQLARREHPHIILLDLGLPGGDGFTVLRTLKQLTTVAHIPVIVFSAWDPSTHRDRAVQAGAVAFLAKPVDNEELFAMLARYAPPVSQERPKSRKILVVEDDSDTRHGVCLRLKASGYEVVEAADSVTAVNMAMRENPNLILLDLGLPGGDGFTLLRRFEVHPSLSLIPVIVVSAWAREAYEARALKAGVVAFLQKPADNAALLAAIQRALGETT